MKVSKAFTFDAAHRLQNHDGKCRGLHGHTYQIEVVVESDWLIDTGPQQGMVVDFGQLSAWWQTLEPSLDHCTLLEYSDPLVSILARYAKVSQFKSPPTAEHLACYIRKDLIDWLGKELHGSQGLRCSSVRVSETAKSWAEDGV